MLKKWSFIGLISMILLSVTSTAHANSSITKLKTTALNTGLIKSDGSFWLWGDNSSGQLLNGTTTESSVPIKINSVGDVVDFAFPSDGSVIVLKKNGTLLAWGKNSNGQLGDGTTALKTTPQVIPSLSNIVQIEGGGGMTIALASDGFVYTWGNNGAGQIGNGTQVIQTTPYKVTGIPGKAVQIVTGGSHAATLTEDGRIYSWGYNNYGAMGDGTRIHRLSPVEVPGMSNIKKIAAGYSFTVAYKENGDLYAWGYNNNGQVGINSATLFFTSPQKVGNFPNVKAINASSESVYMQTETNQLYVWGYNVYGQLGMGNKTNLLVPTLNTKLPNFSILFTGYGETAGAVTDKGMVYMWGANHNSQAGVSSATFKTQTLPYDTKINAFPNLSFLNMGIRSGSLNIISPTNISFSSVTLNGKTQTLTAENSFILRVSDATGTFAGYRVQVQATPLTEVGNTQNKLPAGSLTLLSVTTVSVTSGSPTLMPSPASNSLVLDNGTPVSILSADVGKGAGDYKFTYPKEALSLMINPSTAKIGNQTTSFQSTLNWSIVSGP